MPRFYERLSAYAKTLAIALSSERFITDTPEQKLRAYKHDLKGFINLKAAVKLRYAESVDYRDFEPRIQKLLDTHISASEVVQLERAREHFRRSRVPEGGRGAGRWQREEPGGEGRHDRPRPPSAPSTERLEQDPAFYEKFSKLIQQAIDDYRAKRISDLEYLQRVTEIKERSSFAQGR